MVVVLLQIPRAVSTYSIDSWSARRDHLHVGPSPLLSLLLPFSLYRLAVSLMQMQMQMQWSAATEGKGREAANVVLGDSAPFDERDVSSEL
jgi:hypothetical protein